MAEEQNNNRQERRNNGNPRNHRNKQHPTRNKSRHHGTSESRAQRRDENNSGEQRNPRGYRGDRENNYGIKRSHNSRRDGDKHNKTFEKRGRGGTRGNGRSDRGGAGRNFTEAERLQHSLRPVRDAHQDPELPTWLRANELPAAARNEIKRLQPAVQDLVARHLVMAGMLIDEDPELAHQHALSAVRRAGRIPVTRETLAMTAYRTGDFALALRELRTYRRLNGREDHIALMVDCERGLGRPERGIEIGLAADTNKLSQEQRVYLAIAMSGARLDLGQTRQALFELEIPELQDKRVHQWTAELFRAYAAVLEDLGQQESAEKWQELADTAESALETKLAGFDELEVHEIEEHDWLADDAAEEDATASAVPVVGPVEPSSVDAAESPSAFEAPASAATQAAEEESVVQGHAAADGPAAEDMEQ